MPPPILPLPGQSYDPNADAAQVGLPPLATSAPPAANIPTEQQGAAAQAAAKGQQTRQAQGIRTGQQSTTLGELGGGQSTEQQIVGALKAFLPTSSQKRDIAVYAALGIAAIVALWSILK